MPELPEVETVRRGLAPVMEGALITRVELFRADLRFPFPDHFVERLEGQTVLQMRRRAKYLIADLSDSAHLVMHLGMTGQFLIASEEEERSSTSSSQKRLAHCHALFALRTRQDQEAIISYADPRRFGFMDLVDPGQIESCRHFAGMGPEPLSDKLTADTLRERLGGRRAPLKSALLDQRVVAGLGNIYVCEALYRAGLSPRRQAGTVGPTRAEKLVVAIKEVLQEAVASGGSTLRDFAATDGSLGYFQHHFDVYDREGEPCGVCGHKIQRLVQSGRSSFFCSQCQR